MFFLSFVVTVILFLLFWQTPKNYSLSLKTFFATSPAPLLHGDNELPCCLRSPIPVLPYTGSWYPSTLSLVLIVVSGFVVRIEWYSIGLSHWNPPRSDQWLGLVLYILMIALVALNTSCFFISFDSWTSRCQAGFSCQVARGARKRTAAVGSWEGSPPPFYGVLT